MMNYVGSISILDRGDAPAQAILDKNARSLAQRVADETKEELEKVMNRVETIYESYEQSTQALYETHSSLEYVEDIAELEELLKDQVKKKKYQQQVTIFVVGYENVCGQRLKLLQQVNEFFMDNAKSYEEEDWYPGTPDVDLDDVSQKIEDSLETAGELAQRLGQLNQEMVEWLSNYAISKASNKGKKKLEKALTQAKDDISGLGEKLLGVQTELEEKDEKLQSMLRNLEMKSSEVQKFKTAADVAKKTIEDMEKADKKLKDDMALQNAMIKEMRSKLSEAKIDLSHTKYMKDINTERLQHTTSETQARLDELQRQVDNNKAITEEQKRDLQKLHEKQLLDLHQSHNKDIEEIKNQCAEELKTAQEEIEKVRAQLVKAENLAQSASEEADLMRQSLVELQLRASSAGSKPVVTDTDGEDLEESRPSTKDTKSSRQSVTNKTSGVRSQAVKVQQKLPTKTELKSQSKPGKETSEIAIQDEGGDPTSAQVEEVKKQVKKSKSTLETVQENETEFQDQFDLKDNEAWANLPPQQVSGRFLQYRKLTVKKLEEIEEQLNLTKVKTQRKVQTLKSQFQEHKGKWEAERKVLVEQISQAQKMQTEAEKEADAAMSQLEDFINEQERLENEEDHKRQEVTNEINSSAHVRKLSIETPKTEPEKSVPQTPVTREASSDIHTQSPPQLVQSEDSENELRRLMQQTDDAKAQEMKSRHASGAMSAPPAVEPVADGTFEEEEAFREKILSGAKLGSLTRENVKSQSFHRGISSNAPIEEMSEAESGSRSSKSKRSVGSAKSDEKTHKDAWKTPRTPRTSAASIRAKSANLPRTQESAVENMKMMLEEENLSSLQLRTLESVRSALQEINEAPKPDLTEVQLERTLTLISLASQLTEESLQLGVLPESVFDAFASLNSRCMSNMSHGEDNFTIEDTPYPVTEYLRPLTRDSINTTDEGRSETMPVAGLTDEEGRVPSAKSRASLRSQYRNKLEEARSAAEDRRSKSPAISVPSVRSLEEDQLVEEEDDEDIPVTDEFKVDIKEKEREITMDVGTSPPPTKEQRRSVSLSRQSLAIADHPAVLEYLKIYGGLVNFRDALSRIMVDKEMLQFGQILADLDTVKFEKEAQVFPQLEKMTTNVYYLLEEMTDMLNNLLIADREPVVSSMMMLSRDPSQKTLLGRESGDSGRVPPQSVTGRYSAQPGQSSSEDKEAIRELQIHCEDLQHQLIEESRKHEQQLKHNTVVMMEMQDTINELQRELAALGRASSRMRQVSDNGAGQVPDSAVMFTRLDSERNSKIMKRAVNDDKLDAEKYKDAVNKMDDYVSLPAQRLAHLVRKYVHHCRMKEIEENVKKSRSLNENVFEILDKMEALQNQRAKKWADKMDDMGSERLRLASLLMETLDSIEQESGIFLIKPMYSYRSRDMVKERYAGKLSRPNRPRTNQSPARDIPSAYAPAPTPASNVRGGYKHHTLPQPVPPEQLAIRNSTDPVRPLEGDDAGVMGSSLNWVGTSPRPVWNLNSSQVRGDSDVYGLNLSNTPRILELDINRMLIGQNTISSKLQQPGLTEDRLVNASQNNLRSYVTVNRPTASPSQHRNKAIGSKESVPPSSPAQYSPTGSAQKRVRMSDADFSRNLTNTPPLPPIPTGSAGSRQSPDSDREQTSPPGSSLRHSPATNVIEVISPLK